MKMCHYNISLQLPNRTHISAHDQSQAPAPANIHAQKYDHTAVTVFNKRLPARAQFLVSPKQFPFEAVSIGSCS